MAASSYDEALRRVLTHEGGYTNHPSDPGGPTNFGITIGDYRRYVKPDATAADVRAMRLAEAKAIYRTKYWAVLRCDEMPAGVDYALFDYGVNSGVGRAGRVLQRLLGVAADGRIGEETLAAVRLRDTHELITRLCDERLAFLKRLKTWPVFGAGWGRRVAEVRAAALAMADHPHTTSPAVRDASKTCLSRARKGAAGAIVAAGAAGAAQAHTAGVRPSMIAVILGAVAALAICSFLAWRWYRRRRSRASTTGATP
jgi:lysozyme family protein